MNTGQVSSPPTGRVGRYHGAALFLLKITGTTLNIHGQVGLITKHGILIVKTRQQGRAGAAVATPSE